MAQLPDYVTVSTEVPRSRKDALDAAKKSDGYSISLRVNALLSLWENDPQLQEATTAAIATVQTERRIATLKD